VAYCDKEQGKVEVSYKDKGTVYEFCVRDNGVGINANYFNKIFKIFTKLESTGTSSGIGLSIVKKIVNFYKGDIWVESKEGEGSAFYFTLLKPE
jgi:signal transduction histidine kinase